MATSDSVIVDRRQRLEALEERRNITQMADQDLLLEITTYLNSPRVNIEAIEY